MNLRRMLIKNKPRFKHTCVDCKFITIHDNMDMYICDSNDESVIILIKSDFDSDYYSFNINSIKSLASQNYKTFKNLLKILNKHNIN
jgi:hypothetical protein